MPNLRGTALTLRCCFFIATLLLASGCATTTGAGNETGQTSRFLQAARSAFYDNGTWPLLLGAVAFRASDYDAEVAEYAMEHEPLFSNSDNADSTTDRLRSLEYVLTFGTALGIDESWSDKGERVVVETSALYATRITTTQMNEQVDREYPNGGGNDAFGSHHAASPFAAAALTRRNLERTDMPHWADIGINTTAYAAATASAWGRIEMGLHYPSDQLASAAVGNFIAIFIHDAFLPQDIAVDLSLLPEARYLALHIPF